MRTSALIYLSIPILAAAAASCSGNSSAREAKRISAAYQAALDKYDILLEKNRHQQARLGSASGELLAAQYVKLQEEKAKELSSLLGRRERLPASSSLSRLIQWEQLRELIRQKRSAEALPILRSLEKKAPGDPARYPFYLAMALDAEDLQVRREFTGKLLRETSLPLPIRSVRIQVILQKALMDRLSGKRGEAEALLRSTLPQEHRPEWRERLQQEIAHLALIGKPAASLSPETWLNTALPPGALQSGELKALLFWASWNDDSRRLLLILKDINSRYAARGLQVIGCTRLYGKIRGPSGAPPPLSPAEEIRGIQEELTRLGVTFPVLISPEGRDFDVYSVRFLPTLVMIDRRGTIVEIVIGLRGHELVAEKIPALLGV